MRGNLYTGTSGFAYRQWKPGFYPAKLKNADMLHYYARHLSSVEINNTFYRMPGEAMLAGWIERTPERFAFTLKAPQRITHIARLGNLDDFLGHFLRVARVLGSRLGCILFQCPPYLRHDAERLDGFLAALPDSGHRFAMEFRHPSWKSGEVRDKLAARRIAWCSVDDEAAEAEIEQTAGDFVYLRLRKSSYGEAELDAWAGKLRSILAGGADAYVYFKHEDDPSGVRYARKLLESV